MNELRNILEQLRKTRVIIVLILFLAFIAFFYKSLITEVVIEKINKDEVEKDINNNVMIQQMLNDLMLKYKADRAYIFRFSNSIVYYDGRHRNHTSMAFEVCGNGISSEAQGLQNLPTSLFPLFLQEVMLDKMICTNIDDLQEVSTKISLKKQGVKSLIVSPYFKDGQFVAYIGLDYVKEYNKLDFDYNKFKSRTNEIGRVLTQ